MSVYDCQNARFDRATVDMGNDALRMKAPSIFTTTAYKECSDQYKPIASIEIIDFLRTECNIVPVGASECQATDADRKPHTKHMVRLRHLGEKQYQVGDTVPELLMTNASDLSSPVVITTGLYKARCQNSLVSLVTKLDEFRLRHTGESFHEEVFKGTLRVAQQANNALNAVENWSSCQLDEDERLALATHARMLRFGDKDNGIKPWQLLEANPTRDNTGPDLWSVFNVCQRHVIQGGLHGEGRTAQNRRRTINTKALTSIDRSMDLNKALWALGAATYSYKTPASVGTADIRLLPAPAALAA